MLDDCHFIVGTFSKTLGAIGGYCVSDDPDFDILRVTVRSYISHALVAAAVDRRLGTSGAEGGEGQPELRTQLWSNVATLYEGLAARFSSSAPSTDPWSRAPAGPHDRHRLLARCSMPAST